MKVGFIALGCAKNLVDSEMILGILKSAGIELVDQPELADAIIINTCGFIESAKKETLDAIMEMHQYGKKLIVCGCYAQRYKEKLLKEMPFIDRVITLREYPKIHLILAKTLREDKLKHLPLAFETRLLTGSPYSPYVKIGDGCDNRCTYCAIPLIRGKYQSRQAEDIIAECERLVQQGAKEINLISQDTSRYGTDLPGGWNLAKLLERVSRIPGIFLVRALYLYPDSLTDELLLTMEKNPRIAKYFDIPIQHCVNRILKQMNRRGSKERLLEQIANIRSVMPEATLRTTLIVAFPGETEAEFQELLEFVERVEFDRLGAFIYSPEEDTPAIDFPGRISEEEGLSRYDRLMRLQKKISRKKSRQQIGKVHHTLVEVFDSETLFYYGRSEAFAPDDIDGNLVFQSRIPLEIGRIVPVQIKEAIGYDLLGDAIIEVTT
ncbi:MAG: 30S ribosomal protein S12 methylthiotransferase RimO [Acholeplasmataceae bacterium]|nr:30S ribosomal protein S12 methylthiotransferase RimO [Candidatus Izemoplasmatales bacterium]NLF48505.1 30S ribosomal protein S12 methylthiotransferase RimO [Acholeplasmataceae bacterium]